jgi:hypothetical protein
MAAVAREQERYSTVDSRPRAPQPPAVPALRAPIDASTRSPASIHILAISLALLPTLTMTADKNAIAGAGKAGPKLVWEQYVKNVFEVYSC